MSVSEWEDYIKEHFTYHPDGTLTRNDRKGGNGSYDKDGYLIIKVKGRQFKAHRIAWLLNYDHFPKSELDHINRVRTDNRIENLRESNRVQQNNNATRKPNPVTGEVGIYYDRTPGLRRRYAFCINKKTYRYETLEEAREEKRCLKNLQLSSAN